ncbi:hypothetical protein [Sphingomonas sp. CCH18-H6]|uniref:hypothetical protein n=1 Tax=Sphingomonas sp. CCH18-H6 TaxID=1768787 RepID=UPI0018D2097E|nr:hypothetical protein [Sphingomonas sp. CCH18-H6]
MNRMIGVGRHVTAPEGSGAADPPTPSRSPTGRPPATYRAALRECTTAEPGHA